MAGMKPKIVCRQCGSELIRKDISCPSCGVAVDWVDAAAEFDTASQKNATKKEIQENESQIKKSSGILSSQLILVASAVVVLAVVVYIEFLEKRPSPEISQQDSGQTMSAPKQLPAEVQELENSVAANPDDMSLTLQLANQMQDYNLFERAIPYYKVYLKMNPNNADVRVDMGICYKELGNFTEAEGEMKMALHYVPNHLNAHFNLGIVYLSEGNIEEANKWFKETVALNPNSEVGKRAQQLLTQHNSQLTKQ